MWGLLLNFQDGETNIRSGLCWGHATNADDEMIFCLSCIPFKLSSHLPAECQTCVNKAKSERRTVMQTSWWINSSVRCVLFPSLISALSPSLLLYSGWIQVIKHRLQRLLRPQKEENKNKQQTSTVATVGLEEMKAKVQHILYCNKWHSHCVDAKCTTFPAAL